MRFHFLVEFVVWELDLAAVAFVWYSRSIAAVAKTTVNISRLRVIGVSLIPHGV